MRRSRRTVLYAVLIVGGLLMMVPFFWMVDHVAQDPRRGVRGGAAEPADRAPTGRTTRRCGTPCPGVTFGTFFLNSLKLALLNTAGQLVTCSMAAYAFAAIPFRGRGPAVRAAARDADHPDPGRPRPELHPVAQPAQPVQRERQLLRHPGAAVGRRVAGRRVRDVPAAPVLPGRPDGARRRRPGRRRQPVADLPPDLPAARQAGPRDARDLHLHVDLERPAQPADLPAAPRPVHDDRRARVLPGPVRAASGRR